MDSLQLLWLSGVQNPDTIYRLEYRLKYAVSALDRVIISTYLCSYFLLVQF